jgi:hypothetical protein
MRTPRRKLASVALWAVVWLPAAGPVGSPPAPAAAQKAAAARAPEPVRLPNREGSLKFLVIGDFGTGQKPQYELGAVMAKFVQTFPAQLALTVGDNIYGSERPQEFKRRFEDPYRAVLEAGVKFYASLGNHDSREQARYAQFNMGGKTYYSLKAPAQDVKFVAIESDYPTPKQIEWLRNELATGEDWIIPYFHHPLYSSGKQHGSNSDLRKVLEPLFLKSNVTVVFAGHDHFYERTKPQQGITHFVVGSTGALRPGNMDKKSGLTAAGFESDLAFLAVEIDGDQLYFNAISRTGTVVDSGVIERRRPAP